MCMKGIKMNIQQWIEKVKLLVKEYGQFFKDTFQEQWKQHVTFVLIASLCCIMAAEVSQANGFRGWYYNLINKEVISKSRSTAFVVAPNTFACFASGTSSPGLHNP